MSFVLRKAQFLRSRFVTLSALVLVGCGGGSPADDEESSPFQVLSEAAEDLISDTAGMPFTDDAGGMPKTDTASYSGFVNALVELSDTEIETVYGTAEIDADFDLKTVSGDLQGFIGETVGAINGTLSLSAGTITEDEFDALLTGTLGGSIPETNIDATIAGDFLGANAMAIDGLLSGTTDVAGGFTGGFLGVLSAE